ncbi:hypothetical protein ACFQ6E_41255 [Streptomyces sp. NPDC056462]|uniref:hypothetical protein n=1 Tax=Streptomyces sp. NPDC056462 TaxID=3345826 RepID=UPI0036AAEFA5
MSGSITHLILRDEVEIITDPFGQPRPAISWEAERESEELLRQLKERLGDPEYKQTIDRSSVGSPYGGLDDMRQIGEWIFQIGGISSVLGMIRLWMQVRSNRRAIVRISCPNGVLIELDVSKYSEQEIQEMLANSDQMCRERQLNEEDE